MAKNREPEKPAGTDSEDEEATSDDSDSEPDLTQVAKNPAPSTLAAQKKKLQSQPSSKPHEQEQHVKQPSSSSSSEEEEEEEEAEGEGEEEGEDDESDSDTESDSDGARRNLKPTAVKPKGDHPVPDSGSRKSRSKFWSPDKSAEEKQKEGKDTKKSKKKPEVDNSEKKSTDGKLLFQRIWSEDDEIAILKGMIDYVAKKKSDPLADLGAFHDYIRENLHVDVSRTQLQDKIRRLKKKYANNKSKEKDGKNRTFSKPHEHEAYELSKKIWGNDGGKQDEGEGVMGTPKANGGSVRKSSVKRALLIENDDSKDPKIAKVLTGERANFLSIPTSNSMGGVAEDWIMRMGAQLFEMGKGLEEEKEWKRLKVEELEVYMKQLEVRRAQSKLILDVLMSEDH